MTYDLRHKASIGALAALLIIRENTGNFRDLGRLGAESRPNKPCLLSSFSRNSLLNRTGNYFERTGNFFDVTGNFQS